MTGHSAHTPGPWVIYPETNGTEICAVDNVPKLPIRQHVATVQGTNWIANARLIAAAPELLEACNKVVNNWGNLHPKDLAQLHAAIAKAEAST